MFTSRVRAVAWVDEAADAFDSITVLVEDGEKAEANIRRPVVNSIIAWGQYSEEWSLSTCVFERFLSLNKKPEVLSSDGYIVAPYDSNVNSYAMKFASVNRIIRPCTAVK
jgi:hypothetical protein